MSAPTGRVDLARNAIEQLDQRSRDIFRSIVESYLETGEPMGSRTLSRTLPINLSPATIRNVMQDLEMLGLIYAPHTSAGRLPTEIGLRFFVDSFLEIGDLTSDERSVIEAKVQSASQGRTLDSVLAEAGQLLSGLSHSAALPICLKPKATRRQRPGAGTRLLNCCACRSLIWWSWMTTSGTWMLRLS